MELYNMYSNALERAVTARWASIVGLPDAQGLVIHIANVICFHKSARNSHDNNFFFLFTLSFALTQNTSVGNIVVEGY
jgi:hypothetical protein